jgi:hypothetical protein
VEDPVEVQPPGGDRIFIILRVEKSREQIPFALLDDLPLDLRHGPAIESMVSQSCTKRISAEFTDVVNCSIASKTG